MLCLVFLFSGTTDVLALTYGYAETTGGSGWDIAYENDVDSLGNRYIIGIFQNTIDFDPGAGTDSHTSNGGYDAYLTKHDSDGDYQWTKTWGGTGK